MPIETLIVEDNSTVRRAIADLVGADPELEVAGLAGDAWEGVRRARELHPDVALVDVRMPGGGGPTATREMMKLRPHPQVLAMSASRDPDAILEMLRAGAVGYLVKGGPSEDVARAIKGAAKGESSLSPTAAGGLIETVVNRLESEAASSQERELIAGRIRAAIIGGIDPAFQPILELESGSVAGHEALARFTMEPRRGPIQWFAEAGQIGLGGELEFAAAAKAVRFAADHDSSVGATGFISVNASPDTVLGPDFERILDLGFPPARLVVEVTEHARIEDYDEFKRSFSAYRARGARLAVDDVGAGYASLRHILSLEPDVIKLDLSLTRDIQVNRRKRAMAAAMISFARETDCAVVAEGIETEEELRCLVGLGARFGQGYHLGRPGELRGMPQPNGRPTDA